MSKQTTKEHITYTGMEIAIVGMSGRFPGAGNVQELWQLLLAGRESLATFSNELLQAAGVEEAVYRNPAYVPTRGIVTDVDRFDHAFFGFSAKEAQLLDPQIRVLLECVYEALEDAGCDPFTSLKKIGLFAGANPNLFWSFGTWLSGAEDLGDLANKDMAAARVAYKLNLQGPVHSIFTACSTSLVAVHQACRSLLGGECDLAVAGGVSIELPQVSGYLHQEGMILSKDGHNRSFDEQASGTVFSNGAGVVVLKPLEDALRDNDLIYAIIKGTAVNNDGSRKVGFAAPSVKGQAEVIKEALQVAQVNPASLSYIEAHGSATAIGDPIEVEALVQAFGKTPNGSCGIGSVKSNLGHLNIAAGITGLIKATLSLHHGYIPASLHFKKINPKIDIANSPFYIVDKLTAWPAGKYPRRAGVSSFGVGGTNAHAILEEAPASQVKSAEEEKPLLWLLSAKTETALLNNRNRLADWLEQLPENNFSHLANIAWSLQTGKHAYACRTFAVENDKEKLVALLRNPSGEGMAAATMDTNNRRPVVFLFPGQGAQYIQMGRGLYNSLPAFREEVNRGFDLYKQYTGEDLRAIWFPDEVNDLINHTRYTQPVLYIFEYALCRVLQQAGIEPAAMIGHSLGEYVAATVAGVFSFEEGLRLVIRRGQLIQALPGGAMLAVSLSEAELLPLMPPGISLAAVNSEHACVVAGTTTGIDRFQQSLQLQGHTCVVLRTSHAFHSTMMEPLLPAFEGVLKEVVMKAPAIPYISNYTGTWAGEPTAAYWLSHLRYTVRFLDGLQELAKLPNAIFIEVGPGNTLSAFIKQAGTLQKKSAVFNLVRHPKETISDAACLLQKLGALWLQGVAINWPVLHTGSPRQKVPVPAYAFDKKTAWFNEAVFRERLAKGQGVTNDPLLFAAGNKRILLVGEPHRETQLIATYFRERQHIVQWQYPNNSPVNIMEGVQPALLPPILSDRFLMTQLQTLAAAWVAAYFAACGVKWEKGTTYRADELRNQLSLLPKYNRFFHYFIQVLAEEGLIAVQTGEQEETIHILAEPDITAWVQDTENTIRDRYPETSAMLSLVRHCLLAYPQALSGTIPAISVLFPDGSTALLDAVSKEGSVFSTTGIYAQKVKEQVLQYIGSIKGSRPVRILEVGAGRGELTGVLLPALQQAYVEYYFTDIGRTFLQEARSKYQQQYPFVQYSLLDITKDPIAQGYEAQSFDIVLALDVIHATPVLQTTFNNLQQLLIPGGYILAVENTSSLRLVNLVWGLADGWWDFADTALRPFTPLLPGNKWLSMLQQMDIGMAVTFPVEEQRLFSDHELLVVQKAIPASDVATPDSIVLFFEEGEWGVSQLEAMHHFAKEQGIQHGIVLAPLYPGCPLDTMIDLFNREGKTKWRHLKLLHTTRGQQRPTTEQYFRLLDAALRTSAPVHQLIAADDEPVGAEDNKEQVEVAITPLQEIENRLGTIWKELFGLPVINRNDHYFELGGDSLMMVAVLARIEKAFGVKVKVQEFHHHLTIASLAQLIASRNNAPAIGIPVAPPKEYYACTSAQKTMFYLQALFPDSTAYNITNIIELQEQVNTNKITNALHAIIHRQGSLRTVFSIVQGEPVQKIVDGYVCTPQYINTSEEGLSESIETFIRPFDLTDAPALRVGYLRAGKRVYLIIDLHHIICDGISIDLLKRQVQEHYTGKEVPMPALQYKDFSEWQSGNTFKEYLQQQQQFWFNTFKKPSSRVQWPANHVSTGLAAPIGDHLVITLEGAIFDQLKRLVKHTQSTLFSHLLAAANIVLLLRTGAEDIVIGTGTVGRNMAGLDGIIGNFVNTVPLRSFPNREKSYRRFHEEVKRTVNEALENQDYPYEDLINQLPFNKDRHDKSLFSVAITLVTESLVTQAKDGDSLLFKKYVEYFDKTSKFDLDINAVEKSDALSIVIEYASRLYTPASIQLFLDDYVAVLTAISANAEIQLGHMVLPARVLPRQDKTIHEFFFNRKY